MKKAFNILQSVLNELLLREENRSTILERIGLDPRGDPSQIVKDEGVRAFLLELTRIISLNLVISQFIERMKDIGKHKPWVSKLSSNVRYFQELEGSIWKAVEAIEPSALLQHNIQNQVDDLTIYDITRILESIHVITVYGRTDIRVTTGKMKLRLGEANNLKKRRGAFYTPEKITKFICESTVGRRISSHLSNINETILKGEEIEEKRERVSDHLHAVLNIRVVDPACGPGAFLIQSFLSITSKFPRLKNLITKLNDEIETYNKGRRGNPVPQLDFDFDEKAFQLHVAKNCLYGVDLDQAAAEIASICLGLLAGARGEGWIESILDVNIKQGNSLISNCPPGTVRLDERTLKDLMDLRKEIPTIPRERRSTLQLEYDELVHKLEDAAPLPRRKKGSNFFRDFKSKQPFCWELEFPEVFFRHNRGFDCVVMNPPYEILKPNRSEYVNHGATNDVQRLQMQEFRKVKKRVDEESVFFRKSGQYKLAISNVLNLYRLMIERALQITSERGMLGVIVPSTVLCDQSASKLRSHILSNYKIDGIYDFPEKARVFDGACQAVSILLIDKARRGRSIPMAFDLKRAENLEKPEMVGIKLSEIRNFSPKLLHIPKLKKEAWDLMEKIHRYPPLSKIKWIRNKRGELDLTFYKIFVSTEDTGTKLIRGNHIERYRLNWSPHEKPSYVKKEGFLKKLGNSPKVKDINRVRLAGQQICNMSQEWRLKFCLVEPNYILGNSCNYITVENDVLGGQIDLTYILALLNSRLLNWRFKLTSTNNHINNYELDALPIKIPTLINGKERKLYDIIIENVGKILSQGRNPLLEREIDAAVFLLYGLSLNEMKVVMGMDGAHINEIVAVLLQAEKLQPAIREALLVK